MADCGWWTPTGVQVILFQLLNKKNQDDQLTSIGPNKIPETDKPNQQVTTGLKERFNKWMWRYLYTSITAKDNLQLN